MEGKVPGSAAYVKAVLALIRAQSEGDIEDGLIAAGQVASAIDSIVHVAEFVPRMAEEACEILQALSKRIQG